MQDKSRKLDKTLIATIISALLTAGTLVAFGIMKYRNMYVSSVLVIIYIMIPFFVYFESSKLKAKDLVTLAIMCALASASRAAFIWAPNFKPIGGIIAIIGMAFGPSMGFACGAISILASNMIFGQGAWTPWQMFAFGILGLLAGALTKAKIMGKEKRIRNAIISFLLYFVIAGPILDTASILLMPRSITLDGMITVYSLGVVVNLEQAIATALTVLLLGKPILEKLERLRDKYGVFYIG